MLNDRKVVQASPDCGAEPWAVFVLKDKPQPALPQLLASDYGEDGGLRELAEELDEVTNCRICGNSQSTV